MYKIFIRGPTNALGYMNVIFITLQSPTCFGHSCELQSNENKNKNTVIMCQYHSVVKNHECVVKIHRSTV